MKEFMACGRAKNYFIYASLDFEERKEKVLELKSV